MSFSLLKSFLDLKVFIDYDQMLRFLTDHKIPKEKLPNNRQGAGSCMAYQSLMTDKKLIIVWIDTEGSSGLYIQATIAHEGFHALQRIWTSLGIKGTINEEIQAQALTSVYLEIAEQLRVLGVDFNKPRPDLPAANFRG